MLNLGIRFLICNAYICLLIGVITGLKQLLKKYLSAQIQYNFWFVLLVLLAVPFLPNNATSFLRIFSWFSFTKSTMLNANPEAQNFTPIDQNYAIDKMNDFAVSISSKTPSIINILLLTIWIFGIVIMSILAFHSWRQLHILEKSALPLQSKKVKYVWNQCLSEMNIKETIPVYSTVFLKSPITVNVINLRNLLHLKL